MRLPLMRAPFCFLQPLPEPVCRRLCPTVGGLGSRRSLSELPLQVGQWR